MTINDFADAARAEAEALVDDITRWDDTIATHGPCDGTWDSLAAYLIGRGWARAPLDEQAPSLAEVAALRGSLAEKAGVSIMPVTAAMVLQDARRAARRDEEGR